MLVSQASSALTTSSVAAGLSIDNVLDLLGSINADYQASDKFRVLVNQARVFLLQQAGKRAAGQYQAGGR